MSIFTVCQNLLRQAAAEPTYLANVLNVFLQEIPVKIAYDEKEDKVRGYYRKIAEESHHIFSWLDYLSMVKKERELFEPVDIPNGEYECFELFVTVCANTVDQQVLLCATKQDYKNTSWREKGVVLLDRDEAKQRMKQEVGKASGGVMVMGDVFAGISKSTIVNRSKVEKSFNRVKKEVSPDVAQALVKLAEAVAASGNRGAGVMLDAFNQEVAKSKPDKSSLKSYWESLVQLVPGIGQMVDVVAKITKLFMGA